MLLAGENSAVHQTPFDELPVKWHPCSNGEYVPLPPTVVQREAARRALELSDTIVRRQRIDRRRFMSTLSGAAVCLFTLDACSKEAEKAAGQTAPGGTFNVPSVATTEQAAAKEVLAGQEFIFDVQTHLLPYDLTSRTANFGGGFPQAGCGEADPRACFDVAHFLDALFLQSDTSAIVISALPIYGADNPLTTEAMARTRDVARELCRDERVYLQAQAAPTFGTIGRALDDMSATVAAHRIVSWKTYTSGPTAWRLDDASKSQPQVGQRLIRHAIDTKVPIIAVHKGFGGETTSPADIGPAAAANPEVRLLVYHSGYDGVSEGAYDPASPNAGVDRLVKSLADAGVGPGRNVYADIGSTWRTLMGRPTEAAHVLGKLLKAVGPDNLLWGTDSIWYGSPQDQIQAFRAFQITPEFQERFGYPALTAELKAKVLGLNAAQLFGVDPRHVPCTFSRDELQAAREVRQIRFDTFGPTTRRGLASLLRRLGPLI